MKKLKNVESKSKKRSSSVLSFNYRNKLLDGKNRTKTSFFSSSKIYDNFDNANNFIPKNKIFLFNSLLNDIKKYNYKNKSLKSEKYDLKDINIIKEKENNKLISKITHYLDQKKQKVSLINKLNEPKLENLKKLLYESKSEQDILAKT